MILCSSSYRLEQKKNEEWIFIQLSFCSKLIYLFLYYLIIFFLLDCLDPRY